MTRKLDKWIAEKIMGMSICIHDYEQTAATVTAEPRWTCKKKGCGQTMRASEDIRKKEGWLEDLRWEQVPYYTIDLRLGMDALKKATEGKFYLRILHIEGAKCNLELRDPNWFGLPLSQICEVVYFEDKFLMPEALCFLIYRYKTGKEWEE